MIFYIFVLLTILVVLYITKTIFNTFQPKRSFLHVEYEDLTKDRYYALKLMMALLPGFLFQKIMISVLAPQKRPRDLLELYGKDPYEIFEIEENKVWCVTYFHEPHYVPIAINSFFQYGELAVTIIMQNAARIGNTKQAEQDIQRWCLFLSSNYDDSKQELSMAPEISGMSIVQLKSGGLLLYCPVPIHEGTSVHNLLLRLGENVKYIVLGSAFCIDFIADTIKRYPDAMVIGPKMAELKLQSARVLSRRQFDYNTMCKSSMFELNKILIPDGVTVYYTHGDVGSQATFVIAFNTGLEDHLIYGHHDDCLCSWCQNEAIWQDEGWFLSRIFKYLLLLKPAYLPFYRYAMMDQNSLLGQISWPKPAKNGSYACNELANTFRRLIKLQYTNVIDAHTGVMSANDFKKNLNVNWKWLDGKSLLDE